MQYTPETLKTNSIMPRYKLAQPSSPFPSPKRNYKAKSSQPPVSTLIQHALVFATFLLLTIAGSAVLFAQLPARHLWDINYMAKWLNSPPKPLLAHAIIFGCVMAFKAANLGLTLVEWHLKRFPTNLVIGNALLLAAIFVGLVSSILSGEDGHLLLILLILFELPTMPFLAVAWAFSKVFTFGRAKREASFDVVRNHFKSSFKQRLFIFYSLAFLASRLISAHFFNMVVRPFARSSMTKAMVLLVLTISISSFIFHVVSQSRYKSFKLKMAAFL